MRTSAKPSRPKSTPNVDFASEARVDFDADSDVDVFDKGSRRLREETTKLDYFDAVPAYHVDYDSDGGLSEHVAPRVTGAGMIETVDDDESSTLMGTEVADLDAELGSIPLRPQTVPPAKLKTLAKMKTRMTNELAKKKGQTLGPKSGAKPHMRARAPEREPRRAKRGSAKDAMMLVAACVLVGGGCVLVFGDSGAGDGAPVGQQLDLTSDATGDAARREHARGGAAALASRGGAAAAHEPPSPSPPSPAPPTSTAPVRPPTPPQLSEKALDDLERRTAVAPPFPPFPKLPPLPSPPPSPTPPRPPPPPPPLPSTPPPLPPALPPQGPSLAALAAASAIASPSSVPPLPSAPSPLTPPPWVRPWTEWAGFNCYDGRGAVATSKPLEAISSLEVCKAKCLEQPECEGIVMGSDPICYRRRDIHRTECAQYSSYSTYILAPKPPLPPSPPAAPPAAPSPPSPPPPSPRAPPWVRPWAEFVGYGGRATHDPSAFRALCATPATAALCALQVQLLPGPRRDRSRAD